MILAPISNAYVTLSFCVGVAYTRNNVLCTSVRFSSNSKSQTMKHAKYVTMGRDFSNYKRFERLFTVCMCAIIFSLIGNAFGIWICFTWTSVNPRLGCWLSSCLTGMLLKAIYPSLGLTNVTVNVDLKEGSSKHGKARRA